MVDEIHVVYAVAVFDQHVADAIGLSVGDEFVVCRSIGSYVLPQAAPDGRQIQFNVVVAREDDKAVSPAQECLQGIKDTGGAFDYAVQQIDGVLLGVMEGGPVRWRIAYSFGKKVDHIPIEDQLNIWELQLRERVDERSQLGFVGADPKSALPRLGLATQVQVGDNVNSASCQGHEICFFRRNEYNLRRAA